MNANVQENPRRSAVRERCAATALGPLRLIAVIIMVSTFALTGRSASAEEPGHFDAGVDGPYKDQAGQVEASVKLGEQLLAALNQNCNPKVDAPSSDAANKALRSFQDAMLDLDHAEAALTGPRDGDKSDAYKKHETALADAQQRLDSAQKAVGKWAKQAAAAEKAGDPVPLLSQSTIDAYDKAKADIAREQNWIDKSPEMKAFKKNLPDLKKTVEKRQTAYDRAARDYVKALAEYNGKVWDAVIRAASCHARAVNNNISITVIDETASTSGSSGSENDASEPVTTTAPIDSDGDGIADDLEAEIGTDPNDFDSDHEGLIDGDEWFEYGTDPLNADTDSDGIDDEQEVHDYFTNPFVADTDGDGVLDGSERDSGSDPLDPASLPNNNADGDLPTGEDSDGDGIGDRAEIEGYGTDPYNPDTDGDGYSDFDELAVYLTSPLDAASYPWLEDAAQR